MHALAGQRVEVDRQGGDQGLAFAGAHLGDLAGVQHHAADHLHVVVAQPEGAPRGFAHGGEGLRQDLVERFAGGDSLAEHGRTGLEGRIVEGLELGLPRVDPGHDLPVLGDEAVVAAAEDGSEDAIEHGGSWRDGGTEGRDCTRGTAKAARGRPPIIAGHLGRPGLDSSRGAVRGRGGGRGRGASGRHPVRARLRRVGCAARSREAPAVQRIARMYSAGLTRRPFSQTSKWTWTPVARPVDPILAITSPARTGLPTSTRLRSLWAYRVR